jgi:mannosyltransferase OCH1-like enzyme
MPLPVLSNNKLLLAAKLFGAAIIVFIGIRQLRGTSLDLVSSFRSVPSPSGIPRKIWQTWHTPAALLADGDRSRVGSWHRVNPGYRYELITDEAAESFVRHHFAQDALLRKTFLGLNDTILKADFLRYLIVLAEGGVYADLDVECYQSIDTWLPLKLQEKAGGIVGIEADRKPVENDIKLYSDYRDHIWGINNWAFLAKRGHPFMRLVAETVARNLQAVAKEQDRELSGIELSYKQVIDTTGPGAFSAAFLEYASRITGTAFKPADAMMLEEPKMVGDIVVLPIRAMSTAEADRPDGDGARSKDWLSVLFHWSVGSWKGTHFVKPEPSPDA